MARPIEDVFGNGQVGHCKACGYADTLEDGYCDMCVPGSENPPSPEPEADTHQWSRYEAGIPDYDGTGHYTPLEESTGFDVNAWLKANRTTRKVAMGWNGLGRVGLEEVQIIPPVKCQSGLQFDIIADRSHACRPRNDEGPYTLLELFIKPSNMPKLPAAHREALNQYYDKLWGTFRYVPVELIEQIVDENGGPA